MATYETYETDAVYDEMDNNPTVGNVSFQFIFKSDLYWQAPEPAPPPPKEAAPPKRENENGNSKVHQN